MDAGGERPNTAASPRRSSVESKKAPHRLERPASRAIVPSRVSEKANATITIVPQNSSPRGYSTSPPTHTPSVPSTVTTSGLTPARSSARAIGVKSRVNSARAKRLITRSP